MSSQADYAAAAAATKSAQEKATNARKAAAKVTENKAKIKQLTDSITSLAEIVKTATTQLKNAEKVLNHYQDNYTAYYNAHHTETGYPGSEPHVSNLNSINAAIIASTAQITSSKKKIKDANAIITAKQSQIAALIPSKNAAKLKPKSKSGFGPGGGTGPAPQGESKAFSKDHKYNAPMVSSAYFGVESIQSDVLNNNHVDPGNWGDASQAWKGVNGGRGTIQMDKKFIEGIKLSDTSRKFDLQKYGFKFLYNPTTVSMAWGLMGYMDPPYEATGTDPFQIVSTGLLSSTVQFELMLNRIADFDYVNEYGLRGSNTSNTREDRVPLVKSPYPPSVTNAELKEIYNKGTMYDLEYFFKTVNGPDGTFVSALNGSTSDRAWLRPSIVELHLGNSMRYRVRISQFAVNHIMFNSRMVPILSTVSLTCSRFNDGPTAAGAGSTVGSYSASGASYGANNRPLYQPGGTNLP